MINLTTSRVKYVVSKLVSKYGVLGVVASRYLMAGLHVEINHPTRYGSVHIVAMGNRQRLAIEVFQKAKEVPKEVIEVLSNKAKLIRAKPVLILYGDGVKLSEEAGKLCMELGVRVKRVRP